MSQYWKGPLEQIDDHRWRIPKSYKPGMRVDGLIFASEAMIEQIKQDQAPEQVANVAFLPGIVGYSIAMPDIHWGYGFPVGGVAAMDLDEGVISPGGIGYDINCGVRLLRTDLTEQQVRPRLKELVDQIFRDVPAGFGGEGLIKTTRQDLRQVMLKGAHWMVEHGYGWEDDLKHTEALGRLDMPDPDVITEKAIERGKDQLGTLGGGNHFLEIQVVDEIYDPHAAAAMGITQVGQVTIMIHTGSRGFGHQTCQDHLDIMEEAHAKYGISLPDRQLACAPINSEEGQTYLRAMHCAANFAFANRQAIAHWTRQAFAKIFKSTPESLGMYQVYDVAHNIAKIEDHVWDGKPVRVCVHRKGATRAFPPGHPETPDAYKAVGQPVLIPGDMGRYSFVLVGTENAMRESFGTTCHGAGRKMSRKGALREAKNRNIAKEMEQQGIIVRAQNKATLAEEASYAYKDVADVVEVVHNAGIARKVARLRPIGVVKG
ncbi:MAG: RNA-splicing ligase RtcB [Armatimonadetes bacterium JP3_11]|jgi:tRNA-splicing ligase RtcB|nr:MAG: RNA-splicing ligase RtcB [Armatimonadetes bacterium CP1_7O]OYT75819.1 MAG: RNA-splicing ligase RtcB [Armatimonadetes bacterium JP3_11]RMH06799.1 MAG: RtcB family protein [Armatimonadota bacterium]